MEITAPYTPQYNGVVERRFATLKSKTQATLTQAQLSQQLRNVLWAEAVRCTNTLENLTMTDTHPMAPFTCFTGQQSKLYNNLIEFGRIGYVTLPNNERRNWKNNSTKML